MAKKQHTNKPEHLSQLRTKAEERLQQQKISTLSSDLINQDSSEELIRLIHELEVLHVVLEIQQEELAVTRIDLEESLSKQKQTEDALRKSKQEP